MRCTTYNRRFAREPSSSHDAHRALLAHERLEHVFTWQEERSVTRNLTLHYKRVLYLLEPSDRARAVAGKTVLVREAENGEVIIEHKGVALPARAFAKDARVAQGVIVDNKVLGSALAQIQSQQARRELEVLQSKRMTLREEDLYRKSLGATGLPERRPRGRPTIREKALQRLEAETTSSPPALLATPRVDQLLAHTLKHQQQACAPRPHGMLREPGAVSSGERRAAVKPTRQQAALGT